MRPPATNAQRAAAAAVEAIADRTLDELFPGGMDAEDAAQRADGKSRALRLATLLRGNGPIPAHLLMVEFAALNGVVAKQVGWFEGLQVALRGRR
jgi:hypothetical protein